MSELDGFLTQQREAGKLDSSGELSVDLASLERKLARFRFTDPALYVLKIFQAGVGARCRRISVRLFAITTNLAEQQVLAARGPVFPPVAQEPRPEIPA